MSYILLTTPLILHADPVLPSHAVTRQYVDTKRLNVNASWFTAGVISAARMPALSGDVSSVAGSGTISLNVNGVTAGTYTKVTVDATGRVTAGGTLISSDIASVSWTKITSGRPTTAAGYGITNLISLSGGTVSGNVSSTATPSASLHAVTKGYVDNAITGVVSASLSAGDVIRKPVINTPSGFLRCNGAIVNRSTFPALFAVVGVSHNKANAPNSGGKPWVMQYDFNRTQTAGITGWITSTSLPATVSETSVVVTSNRVILLGGNVSSAASATVYTAPINTDGTLGAWSTGTSLPATVVSSQAVVTSSRVYLLGCVVNNAVSSTVYTAPINTDGTLGAWSTSTSLPATVGSSQAVVTSSRVFLLGGFVNGVASSIVYSATINADGTLGAWSTGTSLPAAIRSSQAIVTSNRVFLLGGIVNGSESSAVYTAPINADGTLGTWSTSTSLPATTVGSQAVVTSNRVYLLGGVVNSAYSTIAYTAAINTDGTLGSWSTGTSLPVTVGYSQTVVTSSRVFLLGGWVNGAVSSTVYSAPFVGGFNDYTNFVTNVSFLSPTGFMLPDFSSLEENNINYFIKF